MQGRMVVKQRPRSPVFVDLWRVKRSKPGFLRTEVKIVLRSLLPVSQIQSSLSLSGGEMSFLRRFDFIESPEKNVGLYFKNNTKIEIPNPAAVNFIPLLKETDPGLNIQSEETARKVSKTAYKVVNQCKYPLLFER